MCHPRLVCERRVIEDIDFVSEEWRMDGSDIFFSVRYRCRISLTFLIFSGSFANSANLAMTFSILKSF